MIITEPLIVDLDGTLIHSDTLHEALLKAIRNKPYLFFYFPIWLLRGKAEFKNRLFKCVDIDVTLLPYNYSLVIWLRSQRDLGRKLILCTATDLSIANSIATHLGLFDAVMATDENVNLAGENKASALVRAYGKNSFDYAGNSSADFAVWRQSKRGIVVNGSSNVILKAGLLTEVQHIIPKEEGSIKSWGKVFRLHQWVKNILIFVPVFAAHQFITEEIGVQLLLAFLSFSLCASSVYIANDLLDLESDRKHPRKKFRPFASGAIPIWQGIALAPTTLFFSLSIASYVSGNFLPWLLVYFALTCAYSWGLKRLALIDCLLLAILYTLRIVAGAAAASIPLSFWLLAFSVFFFLSLAFIKRCAELKMHLNASVEKSDGRGYYTADLSLIQQLGVTSGYVSVLVLALYLNSDNVARLYRTPEIIWGAIPLMILWVSRMWLKTDRGLMNDDPIVFAMKDNTSVLIGISFVATFVLARIW